MAKASAQKKPNGTDSGLNFEAQLWADAEQAVPAPTWKLARMNLAIRGIDANLSPRNADSFRTDQHPDLKAHFILANGMRDLLLSGNSQMPSRE